MPAAIIGIDVMWPLMNNIDTIERLLLGTITAEEAAQELHNTISLWLIE